MRFKKIVTPVLWFAILVIATAGLFIACQDYDNPKMDAASNYYKNEPVLISQATLKRWIDNNYRTEAGKRVVIIDASNNNRTRVQGYIPGAVVLPSTVSSVSQNYGMVRSDGPADAFNTVFDGPTFDMNLQYAGIVIDDVIVITSDGWGTTVPNTATRAWWVFRYWGFSDANVKLLDGGNQGFKAEYGANIMSNNASIPVASTFSVKQLPGNRIDQSRYAFGDVFFGAKNNSFANREVTLINTLAPGYCYGATASTAPCVASGSVFTGGIHGVIQLDTANAAFARVVTGATGATYAVFKEMDNTTAPVKFINYNDGTEFLPADKNARIVTHCGSGQSTTVAYFWLVNMLGYQNTAIYDGSTGEWNALSAFRFDNTTATPYPTYASTTAAGSRTWVQWSQQKSVFTDKDGNNVPDYRIISYSTSNLDGITTWDTSRYSDMVSFVPNAGVYGYSTNPSYTGDAREVNKEDIMYQTGKNGKPSENGAFEGGSGSGGGC